MISTVKHFHPLSSAIVRWIIGISLALIPLFFLPVTEEFYDTNKWMLLSCLTLFIIVCWLYQSLRRNTATFSFTPITAGLGAITITSLLSLLLASTNRIEALLAPFGPVTFINLTIISLLLPSFFDHKHISRIVWPLFVSTTILALISIYQLFGLGKTMFPQFTYLTDTLWTPSGASVATISLFVLLLPVLFRFINDAHRDKRETSMSLLALMSFICVVGVVAVAWQLIPRINGTLLSLRDGWVIMLEILKNPKQALVGVGAENFLAAFTAGRSALLNSSPLWSLRFTTNADMLLHIATIYGLLGLSAMIWYMKSSMSQAKKSPFGVSIFAGVLILLLTPPNLSVLVVMVLFSILAALGKDQKAVHISPGNLPLRIGISCVTVILVGGALIGLVRSYNAELQFYSSLQYAQANNGSATYNMQILAIRTNPYISRYHIIFSQTNLALAASLANSIRAEQSAQAKGSTDTTAKDRQLVAQLLQQAINEAKKAVALDPVSILSWENLARTYQQLIGVAQGADNWTVASYNQAIQLDPTNPVLYVDLGTVFMSINNYTNAITEFQRAIALKSDYANAYYNLANAYRSNNDITQAIATIKQALTLVSKTSDDYKVVTQTLGDYEKEASGSSTISPQTHSALPSATTLPSIIALPTPIKSVQPSNQVTK